MRIKLLKYYDTYIIDHVRFHIKYFHIFIYIRMWYSDA